MKIGEAFHSANGPRDRRPRPGDVLAAEALRDAERETPMFSESLHARVMRALRTGPDNVRHNARGDRWRGPRAIGGAGRDPWDARPWLWRLAPAAAAAIVALAVGSAWYARRAVPARPLDATLRADATGKAVASPEMPAVPVPSLQVAVRQASEQEAALEADLGPGQWAGLDHDARVAVRLVLGPLPVKAPKAVDEWGR